MIQPRSKLPFKEKLVKNDYSILSADNQVVIKDVNHLSDAMFIEECCNNYPIVLEFLKKEVQHTDDLTLCIKLNNLLKQIGENG